MQKFLVIGNPIDHSLSPELHNYWIKINKIEASYEKKLLNENDLENIVLKIRSGEIEGVNVTVPFKKKIIPYLDELTQEAKETNSVNTVYLDSDKVIGHNTDIAGFELGIRYFKYDVKNKNVLILGAGGVVPSIIVALKKMYAKKILLHNRTQEKVRDLKKIYSDIDIFDWERKIEIDMIINATSVGLNKNDKINLELEKFGKDKFFYDIIYNPPETNFLKDAKRLGHKTENGKMMFIYQAHQSFSVWHKKFPKIDDETIKLIEK